MLVDDFCEWYHAIWIWSTNSGKGFKNPLISRKFLCLTYLVLSLWMKFVHLKPDPNINQDIKIECEFFKLSIDQSFEEYIHKQQFSV